ncbi:hypothetical protein ASZ90_005034 [hydrocarbon metagenome]|uniref:Uncharacterized protein n=1 Tax=hydrocarbon metagenome TaxID=938273 RepID=A0A0W8FWD0_9ZZZZ
MDMQKFLLTILYLTNPGDFKKPSRVITSQKTLINLKND